MVHTMPGRDNRNALILEMRRRGSTLHEIGEATGLTRERVRQIIDKLGGPTSDDARRAQAEAQARQELRLRRRIRGYFEMHESSTTDAIAESLGVDAATIRRLCPADLRPRLLHKKSVDKSRSWSQLQILNALRLAATFEFPLTAKKYTELLHNGEISGPSVPLIHQRFPGWVKACELAGVEAGTAVRDNYESRWSDEDILHCVAAYLRHPEFTGSAHTYDKWRRQSAPDGPSLATIRNRTGTWLETKRMAMDLKHEQEHTLGLGKEAHRLDAAMAKSLDAPTRRSIWTSAQALLDTGPLSSAGKMGTTSLALGYVQSGKTTSITALVAGAADAGYRVVIALLGSTNLLLDQNRSRVENALGIGIRTDYVWTREINPSGKKGAQSMASHLDRGRVVFVPLLKHPGRIRSAVAALEAASDQAIVIIDDEADQASLNTSAATQSQTNSAIRELREALPKHLYVQYTATPYAPLLLEDDDLLHPDHVEFLRPGKGYTGGKEFFVDNAATVIRDVPALEEQATKQAPIDLPLSLQKALASFLAGAAILLARSLSNAPVSMLVHSTARNDVQQRYEFLVRRKLRAWLQEVSSGSVPILVRQEADRLQELGAGSLEEEELLTWLKRVLTEAEVSLVNSVTAINKVDWTVSPVHILIGGNKLDRGFTVEGLTVTYMNRPASPQVDTLEQRARAFGYRGDLLPFCQFFASRRTIRSLRDIVFTELDLRARLEEHVDNGGDVATWARDVGLLMPDGMKPTRDAVVQSLSHSTSGWHSLRNPNFDDASTKANWARIRDTGLTAAAPVDYGRLSHPTVTMAIGDAIDLLTGWAAPEMGPGWATADVVATLRRLSEFYSTIPVVLLEEQGGPRVRKWDDTIGFFNLFQGRDASYVPGAVDSYPGDRDVPDLESDPNRPALQIHRVTRRGHQEDVLVPAVYLGDQHITRKAQA